jgi:hypothetical protein
MAICFIGHSVFLLFYLKKKHPKFSFGRFMLILIDKFLIQYLQFKE